jgi:hypothetical protein
VDRDGNTHHDSDAYCYSHAYTDSYPDANGHSNSDGDALADRNGHANSYPCRALPLLASDHQALK